MLDIQGKFFYLKKILFPNFSKMILVLVLTIYFNFLTLKLRISFRAIKLTRTNQESNCLLSLRERAAMATTFSLPAQQHQHQNIILKTWYIDFM